MFRHMPCMMIALMVSIYCVHPLLPLIAKQLLYTTSLWIKEAIILCLPIIIVSLLFKATVMLSKQASAIISTVLIGVCLSNALSTFTSHYVGLWVYSFDLSLLAHDESQELQSLWALSVPRLVGNDKAMFLGIALGMIASWVHAEWAMRASAWVEKVSAALLQIIVWLIPLFIAGFLVKLAHDEVMGRILQDYMAIFIWIAAALFCYLLLVYWLLNGCKWSVSMGSIKHMIPAAISGFSTMSSAASMPLTLLGAENNATHKDVARATIPATVNIHLLGDCFAIPILAYAVLKSFGMPVPSMAEYGLFTLYFVLAKFSVAAVPGGGIIVMLPILESYMGFNAPMMSLITTLYILFDPVITCANVLGNGAFAKMMDQWAGWINRRKSAGVADFGSSME